MLMRRTCTILFLLLGNAVAAEEWDLSNPGTSPTAKRKRAELHKLWEQLRPTFEPILAKEETDPAKIAAAIQQLEQVVLAYERTLQREWNNGANRELCEAVKAWFALRPLLPKPPEPIDEEARKKAASAAAKERRERLRHARKFIMDHGSARRYQNQFRRCRRCDGRKDLRSPFGDKRPCPVCRRKGMLADRKGIAKARWFSNSPLYRADVRRQLEVNRVMRMASRDAKRVAPFVRSVAIKGEIEDHDVWVRITTAEKVTRQPGSKKTETVKGLYTLYRAGRVWYLYHKRYDKELVDIPDPPLEEEEEKG